MTKNVPTPFVRASRMKLLGDENVRRKKKDRHCLGGYQTKLIELR